LRARPGAGIILLAAFLLALLGLAIPSLRQQTLERPSASYDFEDCTREGVGPPGWVIVQSQGAYVQCSHASAHSGSWSVLVQGKGNYSYAYRKADFFDTGRGDNNLTVSAYLKFESIPTLDPWIFFPGKLFHSHLVVYNPQGAVAFGASFVGSTDLLAWRQNSKTPCFPWCTSPMTVPLSQDLQVGIWYEVRMRLAQHEGKNLIEYRVADVSTGKVIAYRSIDDFIPQTKIDRIDIGYDQDVQRAGFADSANTYYDDVTVEASGSANSTESVLIRSANQDLIKEGGNGHIIINEVELNPQYGCALPFVVLANPTDHSLSFQRVEMRADTGGSVSYWETDQTSMQPLTRSIWDPPTKNTTGQIILYIDGKEVDRTPTLTDPWADNRTWQRLPDGSWIFATSTTNSLESLFVSINISDLSRSTEGPALATIPPVRNRGFGSLPVARTV
jgi:hypothetical protein